MSTSFLFLLASFVIFVQAQNDPCQSSYLCTDTFCGSQCGPTDCYVPEGEECYGEMMQLYENKDDYCGCCHDRCVAHKPEGAVCDDTVPGPFPTEMCGPQLKCQRTGGLSSWTCQPSPEACMVALKDFNDRLEAGTLGMNENAPSCDEDGFYSPLQCYRGGLCRCVDRESGEPIFGVAGGETESAESAQDCRCAVNHHDAIKQGCRMRTAYMGVGYEQQFKREYDSCVSSALAVGGGGTSDLSQGVSGDSYFLAHMRCLHNGNFDPTQCVTRLVDEDKCFCLNPDDLKANGTITFQSVTTDLKCYNSTIHNPGYFQVCEEDRRARVLRGEEEEGRAYYDGEAAPKCSPDGYYDKVQHREDNFNELFCSDRLGIQIDSFEATTDSAQGRMMDCECAFARTYLSEGVPKPTCCLNGNYRNYQCQAGQCYCVDRFGRQMGKEVDQLDINDLVETCLMTCGDEVIATTTATTSTTTAPPPPQQQRRHHAG